MFINPPKPYGSLEAIVLSFPHRTSGRLQPRLRRSPRHSRSPSRRSEVTPRSHPGPDPLPILPAGRIQRIPAARPQPRPPLRGRLPQRPGLTADPAAAARLRRPASAPLAEERREPRGAGPGGPRALTHFVGQPVRHAGGRASGKRRRRRPRARFKRRRSRRVREAGLRVQPGNEESPDRPRAGVGALRSPVESCGGAGPGGAAKEPRALPSRGATRSNEAMRRAQRHGSCPDLGLGCGLILLEACDSRAKCLPRRRPMRVLGPGLARGSNTRWLCSLYCSKAFFRNFSCDLEQTVQPACCTSFIDDIFHSEGFLMFTRCWKAREKDRGEDLGACHIPTFSPGETPALCRGPVLSDVY